MKSKPNGNSILHCLPPEQRERVDGWLFDENITYSDLVDRCQQLFNVKVSRSSARRYYERECLKRRLEAPACPPGERKRMASALRKQSGDEYSIAVGLANQVAATEALKPEEHADIEKLTQVTRVAIAARREENERNRIAIQAERTAQHGRKVALLEKKFQFSASVECLKHEREMKAIMEQKGVSDAHRVMEIRERLFGPNLPE